MIQLYQPKSDDELSALLQRPSASVAQLEETVTAVLDEVRRLGDVAVQRYTQQFDGVLLADFRVTEKEIHEAAELISSELKESIALAQSNIERFHRAQHVGVQQMETMPGVLCRRKSIPIEHVGLYIPGGTAPLFSTVLMLGIPAVLAGCKNIVLCSPPGKDGRIHPAILYSAHVVGITQIFKVGGVQAIGAMAYGTESIPKTNKIFGPGNAYVTCAKQLLAKNGFAIDMAAGPSEVAVIADDSVPAAFVAADLLAQAEHGKDSQVIVFSDSVKYLQQVIDATQMQLQQLPRKEIAGAALTFSRAIVTPDLSTAMKWSNQYAPEHLILACRNARELAEHVVNAGSVFIGPWSPESVGDYASGTNHTLPTGGHANAWSGVSLDSFTKKVTFQELTRDGLQAIGKAVEVMAEAEGLQAHANAVTIRLNQSDYV
jgi:histidinol dehydrogenase